MKVYPKNYTIVNEEKPVLSAENRARFKNKINQYLTAQNKPMLLKELIDVAEQWIINTYGIHITQREMRAIAMEVKVENDETVTHPPQEVE